MTRRKTIGVMGGMGPAATVEFFRRLVAATPAARDQDHPRILIDNDPGVPSRTEAILNGAASPEPALVAMAQNLERAGAELLAMPCNTAHHYLDAIRDAVEIPALDMLEETVRRVDERCVGLLATSGTVRTGLYERTLAEKGVRLLVPDDAEQERVMQAIEAVKSGADPRSLAPELAQTAAALAARGAQAVIAGCTEISLVPGDEMPIRWIDALDALVKATLREAGVRPLDEEAE